MVVLQTLDGPPGPAVADELVEVYRAAFTAPGYQESEEQVQRFGAETLPTHSAREGFRLVLARDSGSLRGFAYGYTGQHGMWWTERLKETAPEDARAVLDEWLGGHFEVVELAVDPAAQGRGLGRALMQALLAGLPHQRALLTTYSDDRPAPRLYARLGWQRLVRGVMDGTSDLWGLQMSPSGRLSSGEPGDRVTSTPATD